MNLNFISTAGLALTLFAVGAVVHAADETRIPLTFSGGHETDRRDGGRPVVLVAGGLGVAPEVFREAFSGVTPAKGGPPSPEHARKNKEALMKVLKPHGITNDRLDEVSNYYRYRPQNGEMWPIAAAKGYAVVDGGKIKKVVITDGGSGYSSTPTVSVQGMKEAALKVTLLYTKELKKNGSVTSVDVAANDK